MFFLEQTFHIFFFDRPFTFFGGQTFHFFFLRQTSHRLFFCDTLFTCVCDGPFFLFFFVTDLSHLFLFFVTDLLHAFFVVAAGLPQACPAGCPARASRHHWPGKVPESYTSRVHLWSVLSLSDAMSLMAWALWALGLVTEKDRPCFRLDQIPQLCDFDQVIR